ncbi:hypothetical protein E2C01_027769 [Portunus trituberculatus]|uniref:Uncharacterized protein n=1 Tax=Portunus trituberculatus TaxID=210409 RepID=A0A5B7EJJ2_PORTR|nr:hypothetical protein [Portunus trituberculatus]
MQRNQLQIINKEELIEVILAANNEKDNLLEITKKLTEIKNELASLRILVTSPESATNKKIAVLEARLEKQDEIIAKHQLFMKSLDRKEREANVVIPGVPDDGEALDGALTDSDLLRKVWTAMDAGVVAVKTGLPVMIPGYVSYRGAVVGTPDRGGVVVCVKACIAHLVQSVDISVGDQSALPSDHAPISLTVSCMDVNLNHVLERAVDLGNCSAAKSPNAACKLSRRPVRFYNTDRQIFLRLFFLM